MQLPKLPTPHTFSIPLAKAAVLAECALFSVCIVIYIAGIFSSVLQVVLRQELAVEVRKTESRVAQLEATYLEHIEALTKDRAYAMGLADVTAISYVPVATPDTLTRRD